MAFEGILSQPDSKPRTWRRWMLGVSLGLHGAALVAGAVHSIWQVDELPMPQVQVTLVAAAPPPPPPPPPPARKTVTKTKTKSVQSKPNVLTQPTETPKEPPKEEPAEEEDEGVEGGVEGGVAGGVVGGVVGNQPPPPPKNTPPPMLSPKVARGLLLIDPSADAYRVKVPPALARSGMRHVANVIMCVSAQGTVTSVRLVKGAGPAIDGQIPSVLRRWRYRPRMVDGQPQPFCYPLRYEISAR